MQIVEAATGFKRAVAIVVVDDNDFKALTPRRYSFSWKSLKGKAVIYKLSIEGEKDILGVMGFVDIPDEKRIEIKLLANAIENVGMKKKYDGIAGCLIAFCCRLAVAKYGQEACVSLIPKTELVKHYMTKYGMQQAGWQLYLENNSLFKLLKEYYYEK